MTTIQDNIKEILCEFVSFNAIEDENGGRQKIKFLGESRPLIDKLEQFLIQSIKEVYEEGYVDGVTWSKQELVRQLSITNKEKQNV